MSTQLFPSPSFPPDPLASIRTLVRNSVVSRHTRRAYLRAVDDLFAQAGGRQISRAMLFAYRASMIDAGLSAATINQRLSAIRKLVNEARESDLLDAAEAARITSVPGVPQQGIRLGHWLTAAECRRLLDMPDPTSLIGKRDLAILAVLIYCALRREELAKLVVSGIQIRDGRWVIADLIGKRGRVRTVALPPPAKAALDEWTQAAGITSGPIFLRMRAGGRLTSSALGAWAVWDVVVRYSAAAGIQQLGPHDLRTCAKLCRRAGGDLEQVQLLLGHAELTTTQRYTDSSQDFDHAVNDRLAI